MTIFNDREKLSEVVKFNDNFQRSREVVRDKFITKSLTRIKKSLRWKISEERWFVKKLGGEKEMGISIVGVSVGVFLLIVLVASAIIWALKMQGGRLFEPCFDSLFPEELKPFVTKNIRAYHANRIPGLLKRYEETKSREGNFFSLERFLNEEKALIKTRKR